MLKTNSPFNCFTFATQNHTMKNKSWIIIIAVLTICVYWFFIRSKPQQPSEKEQPMALQKHSAAFNSNINNIVEGYLKIKDAFVEGDTALIKKSASEFLVSLGKLDTVELRKDTTAVYETVIASVNDVKSNAASILNQQDITEMRRDFSALTDMMFPTFFNAIKYEGPTLYLQNCPMAFNDSEPANWISKSEQIMNPYMGKHHPKYKGGMLECGEVKDTIKAK